MENFQIPSDWMYRGEGNCNLVISLPKQKKILRIRKRYVSNSFIHWLINLFRNLLSWFNGFDDELRDLMFYGKVMRPLLGNEFVCDAQQVYLTQKQIKLLEKELSNYRPDFRKHKILQYGRATLFHDYTFLPFDYKYFREPDTFAIEIKPKQGWAPVGDRIFHKCIFCMKQYLKLKHKEITHISSYCPKDLFSGDKKKMIFAIKSLIYNPQNNFAIFKNGKLYYGTNMPIKSFYNLIEDMFQSNKHYNILLEEFCLLIINCLIKNFGKESNKCDLKLCKIPNKLPKGSVLERILSIQMLDLIGNVHYYKLLENKYFNKNYDYVNKLLQEIDTFDNICLKCIITILAKEHECDELHFIPYLISAIARDCSIMLTYQKAVQKSSNVDNLIETKFGKFVFNIGVFDLYPKPLSTITKHRKKMNEMQEFSNSEVN